MQLLGYLLVVIGTAWMMMCFLGTAMISPSIDMYTEALLPSVLGFLPVGAGVVLIVRQWSERKPPA